MKSKSPTQNVKTVLLLQELLCRSLRFPRVCEVKVEEHGQTISWAQTFRLNASYTCFCLCLVPRSEVNFCAFPK